MSGTTATGRIPRSSASLTLIFGTCLSQPVILAHPEFGDSAWIATQLGQRRASAEKRHPDPSPGSVATKRCILFGCTCFGSLASFETVEHH
jgi:hypothetical protein